MVLLHNPEHFDLKTIADSGQCFRVFQVEDNTFDVLSMDFWVRVYYKLETNTYIFDCEDREFENFGKYYFELIRLCFYYCIQQSNE